MRYARSSFRIKPRTGSKEELGLWVACANVSQAQSLRVAWAGAGRWGLVGGPLLSNTRFIVDLCFHWLEWSVEASSQFHDLLSLIPPARNGDLRGGSSRIKLPSTRPPG